MMSHTQRDRIRASFEAGRLHTRSVSPCGDVAWKRVRSVSRAEVTSESIHEVTTEFGTMVLTGGHRVFVSPTEKVEAEQLQVGHTVLGISGGQTRPLTILSNQRVESRQYMYDLTADDWHNFMLSASNAVISNSPDRNYHFRPPTGEGTIGCNNQVFGYIWEDEELLEYLKIALDKWNMQPPETEELCTLDAVCQKKPAWKAALLWGAVVHAALALSFNWTADEFSISGGIPVTVNLPDGRMITVRVDQLYDILHGAN